MSEAYLVVLGSVANDMEIVPGGVLYKLTDAQERAAEAKRCRPDDSVRIFKHHSTAELSVRFDGDSSL